MPVPSEDRLREIEARMLTDHNIALGCWGIPEGATYTFTRRAFYGLARDKGVMTPEEHDSLARALASIWEYDLSD